MHETSDDLAWLQDVLDRSYDAAGGHLRSIHTDAARLDAAELVERLDGMQILVAATVTADGRPLTGPVDAFLYRGRFRFGTASDAVRARHLRRRPVISATHVRGETLVVTVHGRARPMDLAEEDADFAGVLRDWYGEGGVSEVDPGAPYWTIEPDRMFAADMSVHVGGSQ